MHLLVGGPARAWNMLLACETTKNLELFEMHSCHWPGARIWLRHEKRKLDTASFYLIILMDIVSCLIGLSFLLTVSQVSDRTFLVLHFDGNVYKWIPKVIWPWRNWFWVFLFQNGFFRWLHIVTDWNLQWLLNCHSFWRHRFVRCLVGGVFWPVVQNLFYFSTQGFCQIDWIASGMQFIFIFKLFVSTSLFFCEVVVKFFGYSRKLNRLFFKFCLNCLLGCYLVYSNNCALKDVHRAC